MNRMQQAVDRFRQRMNDLVGITIIYHRGDASTSIDCWLSQTAFRINDNTTANSRLIWSERDYIIPVENLKINGILVEPDYGDWMEETDQRNVTRKFEISAPQGEQAWHYFDQEKTMYQIHTKERV